MMEKSVRIYLFGFTIGLIACFVLLLSYPWVIYALLSLLVKKGEIQTAALGGSQMLSISINNVVASLFAAYGGYLLTKVFLFLNTSAVYVMPRLLGVMDAT